MDFKQANLANRASCERVFTDEQGAFDYVFHLAGETKYGQTDEVKNLVYTAGVYSEIWHAVQVWVTLIVLRFCYVYT